MGSKRSAREMMDPVELTSVATRDNQPEAKRLCSSNENFDEDMHGANGELMEDYFEDEDNNWIIADGEYKIETSINQNFVAALSEGDQSVNAFQYFGLDSQKWNFIFDSNKDAYKITNSQDSNLTLTWMLEDDRAVCSNLIDKDNQYWRIDSTEDGLYKLRNLHNEKRVLELTKGAISDKSQIQLAEEATDSNDLPNQKWKLAPISYQTVPNGEYKIATSMNQDIVADLSDGHESSVQLYPYHGLDSQKWDFIYDKNRKAYKIASSQNSNFVLTWMLKDDRAVGSNFSDYDTQYWRIERTEDGYYKLRNLYILKRVLDLAEGSTNDGSRIQLAIETTNPNDIPKQKWEIDSISYQTIPDGKYKISSCISQNVVVDLCEEDQSSVYAHQYLGADNQKWKFLYDINKKAYKITNSKNSKSLTWMLKDNSAVGNTFTDCNTQYWRIERTKDGYFKLRNLKDLKLVLDLASGSISDKSRIQLAEITSNPNNMPNQKWALSKMNTAGVPDGEYHISSKINHTKLIAFNDATHNLIISDYIDSAPSYWRLEYDGDKNAYKIYSKDSKNKGLYFQNSKSSAKVDNIDISDSNNLRPYWTIEYNVNKGGYLISSLHDPSQVLDLENSDVTHGNPILNNTVNNNNNQLWKIAPKYDF